MGIQTLTEATEESIFNSCQFCAMGRGIHKHTHPETGEVSYLCADHKAECYDQATDAITPPAAPPAPEPEAEPEA